MLREVRSPLSVEQVELLPPRAREVRLELVSSGVCHSDLYVVQGHIPANLPMICGHEGAGIVTEVGSEVTRVKVGDHAVLSWVSSCGTCPYCASGHPNLCETTIGPSYQGQLPDGTSRFRGADGHPIGHHLMISSFSRDVVVPESGVVPVPTEVPLKPLAVLGCAVATGVGAAVLTGKVALGDTVAVIGCGGVGLNAIQGARLRGAARIIGVDVASEKLDQAQRFGATDTVDASQVDSVDAILELTKGAGVDVAIEAVGRPDTLSIGVRSVRRGGTAVAVGMAKPGVEVPVEMLSLLDERRLVGCYYGSLRPAFDLPRYVALYAAGRLLVDELITTEIAQHEINDALRSFDDGKTIRTLVRY